MSNSNKMEQIIFDITIENNLIYKKNDQTQYDEVIDFLINYHHSNSQTIYLEEKIYVEFEDIFYSKHYFCQKDIDAVSKTKEREKGFQSLYDYKHQLCIINFTRTLARNYITNYLSLFKGYPLIEKRRLCLVYEDYDKTKYHIIDLNQCLKNNKGNHLTDIKGTEFKVTNKGLYLNNFKYYVIELEDEISQEIFYVQLFKIKHLINRITHNIPLPSKEELLDVYGKKHLIFPNKMHYILCQYTKVAECLNDKALLYQIYDKDNCQHLINNDQLTMLNNETIINYMII